MIIHEKDGRAVRQVYFIQIGTDGPIKIGMSDCPEGRLYDLQVSCPSDLRILRIVIGSRGREMYLQRRFGHHWIQGEWFRPGQDLLDYIQTAPMLDDTWDMPAEELFKFTTLKRKVDKPYVEAYIPPTDDLRVVREAGYTVRPIPPPTPARGRAVAVATTDGSMPVTL